MEKEVIEALNKRYATKVFDEDKKISSEKLDVILEALRLTPTSYGLQLMKVVVVENSEIRKNLVKHTFGQEQVKMASHLIVLCREKMVNASHIDGYISTISKTRGVAMDQLDGFKKMIQDSILELPENKQNGWMDRQVYIALGNMLTVCAMIDVDACPMEGFNAKEYNEILGLTEKNLSAVLVVPIGYHAVSDYNATNKKVRRSSADFILRVK